MSAHTLHLPRDAIRPLRSDFATSLIGWGGFILLLSCYCTVYQVIVNGAPADPGASFSYVFKNWGVWLLTTPVIFAALRSYSAKWHDRAVEFVVLATIVVFVSTAVPVAIDLLTNARDAASSLLIFLPRYIAVVAVVYLIWHVFLRERRAIAETVDHTPSPVIDIEQTPGASEPQEPATLLVSKGADQCLIQVGRIESVSAAGNYVEIVERGQRYLMRATLKQVEDLLPATDFIRIHRCHLVRRDEIERIRSQPSGNGIVHLRGGQALPMSKKHKQAIQRYRPAE